MNSGKEKGNRRLQNTVINICWAYGQQYVSIILLIVYPFKDIIVPQRDVG